MTRLPLPPFYLIEKASEMNAKQGEASVPLSAETYKAYQEYLHDELAREDYFEALRSLALLTYLEEKEVLLPTEQIAILMLEDRQKTRLPIWWHLVKPSD